MRQLSREPSGNTPGPSRIEPSSEALRVSRRAVRQARLQSNHPPKRHERAIGQYAGPVSIRTIHRSVASEPSGNAPGPSRIEPSAEAPRASHQAIRRARLHPNHPPKRRERAIRQYAGPVSIRTIHRSDTQASRQASRRARLEPSAGHASNHPPKGYTSDPSSKPLPRSRVRSGAQAAASGRRRYRTEPLRLFAVNPLTVGEIGRRVIGEVILV